MIALVFTALFISSPSPASRDGVLSPTVEFKINTPVIAGEPVYIRYTLTNPNGCLLAIRYEPDWPSWHRARIERTEPLMAKTGWYPAANKPGREPRPTDQFGPRGGTGEDWLAPHEALTWIAGVGVPDRAGPGQSVTAVSTLRYLAWPKDSHSFPDAEKMEPLRVEQSLSLEVNPADPESLAARALDVCEAALNVHVYCPELGVVDPRVGPPHCPMSDLMTMCFSMPARACAASWLEVLRHRVYSDVLAPAVYLLARRKDPDADAVVQQIIALADSEGPEIAAKVRYAATHALTMPAPPMLLNHN